LISFERLAQLYHELLGQESLEELLAHAADALSDLIPYSSLLIGEVDRAEGVITPVLARGTWCEETLQLRPRFGEGLIGWVVERGQPVHTNEAHHDPRAGHVEGTPAGEPEAMMCLPLVAQGEVLGALSLYREGRGTHFSRSEFELAFWFADAVTLALAHTKTRAQLEALARTDDLTGCLNRRGLCLGFDAIVDAAAAAGQRVALLLVDLNDFKAINDRFGHSTGDLLLQHVVHALRACAPHAACVGRLGGDEFAVVFATENELTADATSVATTAAVSRVSFLTAKGEVSVTASIGAAVSAQSSTTLASLLEHADATMYRAKETAGLTEPEGSRRRRRRTRPVTLLPVEHFAPLGAR
jgi:diguanylate cyclase (GGDEF)-like protein